MENNKQHNASLKQTSWMKRIVEESISIASWQSYYMSMIVVITPFIKCVYTCIRATRRYKAHTRHSQLKLFIRVLGQHGVIMHTLAIHNSAALEEIIGSVVCSIFPARVGFGQKRTAFKKGRRVLGLCFVLPWTRVCLFDDLLIKMKVLLNTRFKIVCSPSLFLNKFSLELTRICMQYSESHLKYVIQYLNRMFLQ